MHVCTHVCTQHTRTHTHNTRTHTQMTPEKLAMCVYTQSSQALQVLIVHHAAVFDHPTHAGAAGGHCYTLTDSIKPVGEGEGGKLEGGEGEGGKDAGEGEAGVENDSLNALMDRSDSESDSSLVDRDSDSVHSEF